MIDDRLTRQLRFMAELDKAKQIVRRTLLMDGSRFENDAEHSWHMAIYAAWMAEYASPGVNVLQAVKMCLIHDIVEIDAGDTYAFDPAAQVGKQERERYAADRIFGLLPDDQGRDLRALWEEFEAMVTPEARFAAALDRVQGVLQNYHVQGRSWHEHAVKRSQLMKRIEPVKAATPRLWQYLLEVVEESTRNGWLAAD